MIAPRPRLTIKTSSVSTSTVTSLILFLLIVGRLSTRLRWGFIPARQRGRLGRVLIWKGHRLSPHA
jgi:hypothetical protein